MRDDIKEYNAVENLGKKFCEAVKEGDSSIVKPYFMSVLVSLGN